MEHVATVGPVVHLTHVRGETDAGLLRAIEDDLSLAPAKAPPQMNRMLVVSTWQELLLRMLATALRRHRGNRALDQLQQRLLHAFARNVARDRRVVRLREILSDLVDVDDARLRLLDVVGRTLQQLLNDVLDVLADVARFGERRGVGDGERYVQQARQRLGEQRLAAAVGPISRMLLLASSTSSFERCSLVLVCRRL